MDTRTQDDLRQEATNLGMTPQEAGRYIEDALEAQDAAAEAREAEGLLREMRDEP